MSGTADDVRVLHVDDEPDFADMAATFLEREDDRFDVETATTASDGLDQLSEDQFDCVISDYDMPGQNGIELLETVRDDYPDLPFILYTGKGSEEVASDAISAGVTDYLQKQSGTDQYTVLANRIRNAVERRAAERERNRQLEAIETAQEGISILDEDGHYIYVNRRFADLHGYDPDELIGEHWELVYRDDDVSEVREEILPEVERAGYWHGETTSLRADGTTVTVDHTLSLTDRGELICTVRDLSERKARQRELRQKTARLEALFDNSPVMINVHDMDGNLIDPNPRLCEKTGYDAAELTDMNVWDVDQTMDPDGAYALWEDMEVGDRHQSEGVYRRRDGSTFPVEVHIRRLRVDGDDRFVVISRDITARKERERELRRAKRQFEALFEDQHTLVGLIDTDGTVLDVNETALEYIDAELADVTGEPFAETPWWSAEFRPVVREKVERAAEGEYVEYEADLTKPNGEPYSIEGVIRPVTDEDSTVVSLIVSARDVTPEKEREQRLEQYRKIVETMDDIAFVVSDEWTVEFTNETILEYVDVPLAALEGRPVMRLAEEFVAEDDDPERFERALEYTFQRESEPESPRRVELTLDANGGSPVFEYQFSPLVRDGETTAAIITMRDVTERRRRERELQRYEALIETLPIGYVRTSFDDEFLEMNSTFIDMLDGESADVIRSHSVSEFYRDATTREQLMDTLRHEGEVAGEEVKVTTTSGDTMWVMATARLVDADEGPYVDALVQDITERKRHAEQLRALNERSQMLMSADSREQIAEVGVEAAREVLGLEASAIHLQDAERSGLVPVAATDTLYDLIGDPPVFTSGDSIAWRAYDRDEAHVSDDIRDDPDIYNPETPMQSELYFPLGDHGILLAGSQSADAFDEQDFTLGKVLAANIASALDQVTKTERLRARETALTRQNERLEKFASIVSHDLRNPLSVAEGNLELARAECDSEHLEPVDRALDRMDALIEDLLTLAREGATVTESEPVDLAAVAESCWTTVETSDATLVIDLDRTIDADESRLKQVFANLYRNAVEHGGEDVTVTVGELEDGFYVEDDGPGIPEDERDEVFDAGYSTHEAGTGFGLSIVEEVVDVHDWEINVTEGSGGGARFEITGVETG